MERRSYQKQISVWWEALETESDNYRVNPNIFKNLSQPPDPVNALNEPKHAKGEKNCSDKAKVEDCFLVKEALQKLIQFLNASHQDGCSDKNCHYNSKLFKLKLRVKRIGSSRTNEVKILRKRGRKSRAELQQIAALQASNGVTP